MENDKIDTSIEALDMGKVRAKIEARICKVLDIMDPSGDNSKRMKQCSLE